jgi:uncharacterized iron-regulated membrane protein
LLGLLVREEFPFLKLCHIWLLLVAAAEAMMDIMGVLAVALAVTGTLTLRKLQAEVPLLRHRCQLLLEQRTR